MDYWILKQLRAHVLSDLRAFIPDGYFESEKDQFALHEGIESAKHLSFEIRWGYLAATLGKELYFESTSAMSGRQVAASEVLMHLGMLAGAEASMSAAHNLSVNASKNVASDGNTGNVAEQLRTQHIPTFQKNVAQGLKQYLLHLTVGESLPYRSLLLDASIPIPPVL